MTPGLSSLPKRPWQTVNGKHVISFTLGSLTILLAQAYPRYLDVVSSRCRQLLCIKRVSPNLPRCGRAEAPCLYRLQGQGLGNELQGYFKYAPIHRQFFFVCRLYRPYLGQTLHNFYCPIELSIYNVVGVHPKVSRNSQAKANS